MSRPATPDAVDLNASTPAKLERRVVDLGLVRRSLTSLRGTISRSAASVSNADSTSTARLESSQARHTDPETIFREKYLVELAPSQPLKDRLRSLKAAGKELEIYSVDTLMALWTVIEDLRSKEASAEKHIAAYDILLPAVGHSGLDSIERLQFFSSINLIGLPAAYANLQIRALERLTQQGKQLSPFESDIAESLNNLLEKLFTGAIQARALHRRQRSQKSNDPIGEEVGLTNLLTLIYHTIRRSPDAFQDKGLALLFDGILVIFNTTTVINDIDQAIMILECLISHSCFPVASVEKSVEVLCALFGNPLIASEGPRRCLHRLLTSEWQAITVEGLLRIISLGYEQKKPHVLLGAFSILDEVLLRNGEGGFPIIALQPLSIALRSVWRLGRGFTIDCLRIAGHFIQHRQVNDRLLGEDWIILESTLDEIARLAIESPAADSSSKVFQSGVTSSSPFNRYFSAPWSKLYTDDPDVRKRLQLLASAFEGLWDGLDRDKRLFVMNVFLILESSINDNLSDLVIQYMAEERLIYPPNENWARHLEVLVHIILLNPAKPEAARRAIMHRAREVYAAVNKDGVNFSFWDHIGRRILAAMVIEERAEVLSAMADFMAEYALDTSIEVFDYVIDTFSKLNGLQGIAEVSTALSENFTVRLVRLFLQCLPFAALKTVKIYEILVSTATSINIPLKSRLVAMKLLFRLRCDPYHSVKVVPVPDSLGLAAALCRTEASAHAQSPPQTHSNRISLNDDYQPTRMGRTNAPGPPRSDRSRSATRSASGRERFIRPTPPLWMYGGSKGLPQDPPGDASSVLSATSDSPVPKSTLKMSRWMDKANDMLSKGDDWEVYSYLLIHLPSQLINTSLFESEAPHIQKLHELITGQLQTGKVHTPPTNTGMKQGDVALCLLHTLTVLISYRDRFNKKQLDDTVRTFLISMEKWDGVRKCCIHALALCSHEIPLHLDKFLDGIVQKMSQIITQSHLAMDILEFLAGLVRLPDAYRSTNLMLFRTIFGICREYLKNSRKEREKPRTISSRINNISSRQNTSAEVRTSSDSSIANDVQKDLPEYVFTLAYHVITFWFLAIDIQERSSHVGWISKNLCYQDDLGHEIMEEQSQVTLDMMHRTAYSDLGETRPNPNFYNQGSKTTKKTWLVGMSIVTVETFGDNGFTQITKRQASGTTYAIFQQQTAPLPPHHVQRRNNTSSYFSMGGADILPNHVLLQLSSTITPMPIPLQPIILPDDDSTRRAISMFDRNDTVDGHKMGVIYIAKGQNLEPEILANTSGTALYEEFLSGLGTKVRLRDAKFNTQGLDRESDSDGTHTYAWRDRVTEIVFHVVTMMPTNIKHDPQCINKKRHIGNDFVNIIYNDSGLSFDIDTFKSQFNYVNIIITPDAMAVPRRPSSAPSEDDHEKTRSETQAYFRVQTVCFPWFPHISPAATPKLVSASTLPGFVRQLALNACVFSLVWSNREGGEYISSWRNRLREINRLRERYANTAVSANTSYPDMGTAKDRGGARDYLDGDSWKGTLMMGGLAEENQMSLSLDFTRWT